MYVLKNKIPQYISFQQLNIQEAVVLQVPFVMKIRLRITANTTVKER